MKAFVLAVVLLMLGSAPWGAERAGAQGVDSCLAYYDTVFNSTHSHGGLINTDSALIDTCSGSSTYRGIYVKQWFNFAFQYGSMLQLPAAPADTILEVFWTAIDTNYLATRSAFQALETKYGSFLLRKLYPDETDTSEPFRSKAFKIRFLNYVCEDSAFHDLKGVPEIDDTFMQDGLLVPPAGVVSSSVAQESTIVIFPNPAQNAISILRKTENPIALYNANGVWVKDLNPLDRHIPLAGMPPGNYFLRSATAIGRFIKEP